MKQRMYICIDLKTFYASVECLERGLDPFKTDLVVANPQVGSGAICLAISPHMKERGIRNRCRVFEIPKEVKYITAMPRMKKYIEYSANIYGIYLKYIDKSDIHVYSIDEAFLDVTDYLKMYNMNALDLAKTIMKDIYDNYGITATAGIGTNLYLTKIALDITAKHVKSHIGYLDEEKYKQELWHHKPLTDFWQIGRGIATRLNKLGLYDMYDISVCDEKILYKEFGINARLIIDHSKGIEKTTIKEIKAYKPKSNSISNGQILINPYNYLDTRKVLTEMIAGGCLDLVKKEVCANGFYFYIGYHKSNESLSISKKFPKLTNNYHEILKLVLQEYDKNINKSFPVKRINIGFFNIEKKTQEQLDLFTNVKEDKAEEEVEKVMNNIKNKFGKNAILRGISLDDKATQRERNKLIGGHNAG